MSYKSSIIIGIPKEVKTNEFRVALTPYEVQLLISDGYNVCVESCAGIGCQYVDDDYVKVGAHIVKNSEMLYNVSHVIIKVKEPQESEYGYITNKHIIMAFFHFASNEKLTNAMNISGARCIAYETIIDKNGDYPILAPMSKIAGEQAIIYGDIYIKRDRTTEISIIGAGNVGMASARKAKELGYIRINLMDCDIAKMEKARAEGFKTYELTDDNIWMLLRRSKIVIGSIYVKGTMTPKIIKSEMMHDMLEGSIIMDVAIDQGGITEQSYATSISNPLVKYGKTSIYCVPNIPACVPREATSVLSKAIYNYISTNEGII